MKVNLVSLASNVTKQKQKEIQPSAAVSKPARLENQELQYLEVFKLRSKKNISKEVKVSNQPEANSFWNKAIYLDFYFNITN